MINSKINKKDLKIKEETKIIEDIQNDLEEEEEEEEEEQEQKQEEDDENIQAPKKRKVLNENQRKAVLINLAKGRENLKKKQEQQRIEREQRKEELKKVKEETILRKANQIKQNHNSKMEKTKTKINKIIKEVDFGLDSNEIYDEEEIIITKKT